MSNKTMINEKILSKKIIDTINETINDFSLNDNAKIAEIYVKKFKKYGFKEIGCGTNRIVFSHNKYHNVVIKVPLDTRGVSDNNAEHMSFNLLRRYVPQIYFNNGTILIAEKVYPFKDIKIFNRYLKEVNTILDELKHTYILNDVSPKSFKNWGIDYLGNLVILDYAYLMLIKDSKNKKCLVCKGDLDYTKDSLFLQCTDCGRKFSITNVTGTYEDTITEVTGVNDTFDNIVFRYDTLYKEDKKLREVK